MSRVRQQFRTRWPQFLAIAAIMLFASLAAAQVAPATPAADPKLRLTFEVASVKVATDADQGPHFDMAPDGAVNIKIGLTMLLFIAYGVKDFQVIGFPKAMESTQYRITAKPPQGSPAVDPGTRNAQFQERLQSLLEERFHLVCHKENRDLPLYELVVAKGGPKLTEVPANPANFKLRLPRGRILLEGGGTMSYLAILLGNHLNRPVTDKTGLTARYAIDLQFAPLDSTDDPRPSLFTALQEQLGLKLEARKGPSEVLVIDHVEKPSEN
jgi:uncharacterized protein (TIGR03435 family)